MVSLSVTLSTTMTCPGTYPTVLNGQVHYNDSTTVEYGCLAGFYMTGNKRISCSAGVWQTTPTCTVIRQHDEVDVFPDWWFYVLAALLALLVLAIFLCIILRFCHCWCCRCCDSTVNPYHHHQHRTGVTTVEEVGEDPSQVYFVPVHATTPTQDRYFSKNKNPKTKSTGTDMHDMKNPWIKTTATNTDTHYLEPGHRTYGNGYGYNGRPTAVSNGTPRATDSYAWSDSRAPRHHGHTKAWKETSNFETRSDGDLNDGPLNAKKPAKEVRAWLPHRHPVRNINTSTK